jgi:hypothetical protein
VVERGSTLTKSSVASAPEADARPSYVGRTFQHFRIVDQLGAGGMGVVYRAIDDKLGRSVALKVLGSRYVVDERNRELIRREARSAAALNHPNIASIYDLHDTSEGAFYVMELVDGTTLRARGKVPVDQALRWARQIASALAHAHAARIVHRDLKPDNIMITRAGDVKLLDFGLAKVLELADVAPIAADDRADVGTASTCVSSKTEGRIVGTPNYMAPEQARGEPVDERADVFAFGAILYEMLAGRPPFERSGMPSGEASSGDWTISTSRRSLAPSRRIDRLVTECLAFDRLARPRDGADLVAAIDRCLRSPRGARRIAMLAITIIAVVGIIGVALLRSKTSEQRRPSIEFGGEQPIASATNAFGGPRLLRGGRVLSVVAGELQVQELGGTAVARIPSPDGSKVLDGDVVAGDVATIATGSPNACQIWRVQISSRVWKRLGTVADCTTSKWMSSDGQRIALAFGGDGSWSATRPPERRSGRGRSWPTPPCSRPTAGALESATIEGWPCWTAIPATRSSARPRTRGLGSTRTACCIRRPRPSPVRDSISRTSSSWSSRRTRLAPC